MERLPALNRSFGEVICDVPANYMILIDFPTHLDFSPSSCSSPNACLPFMPKRSKDWSIPIASVCSWPSLATRKLPLPLAFGNRSPRSQNSSSSSLWSLSVCLYLLNYLTWQRAFLSLSIFVLRSLLLSRWASFSWSSPSLWTSPDLSSCSCSGFFWHPLILDCVYLKPSSSAFLLFFYYELTLSHGSSIKFSLMSEALTSAPRLPLLYF